ncbi:LANO_0C00122g1_1 [Lachancea nothofagi CBS 11611]|uniref:LANO_0C00122g1_1 n=1 Tax=Lachancea nothofagi CBS 11611 TaxID=1266666 RepID=A0A1G4J319_9SACH|nr:LANO_0C00122g1_1 [Lachancea nothofagi CBS 11611]
MYAMLIIMAITTTTMLIITATATAAAAAATTTIAKKRTISLLSTLLALLPRTFGCPLVSFLKLNILSTSLDIINHQEISLHAVQKHCLTLYPLWSADSIGKTMSLKRTKKAARDLSGAKAPLFALQVIPISFKHNRKKYLVYVPELDDAKLRPQLELKTISFISQDLNGRQNTFNQKQQKLASDRVNTIFKTC